MAPDRAIVKKAILDAKGNLTRAAALLGCSRQTLYTWVYQLGLEKIAGVCMDRRAELDKRDRLDTRPTGHRRDTKGSNPPLAQSHPSNRGFDGAPILRAVESAAQSDLPYPATVRIRTSLWKRARIRAIEEDCNVSELLERALDSYLGEQSKRRVKGKDE